jgi:high-affinity Fe2+/Pb2+ permease
LLHKFVPGKLLLVSSGLLLLVNSGLLLLGSSGQMSSFLIKWLLMLLVLLFLIVLLFCLRQRSCTLPLQGRVQISTNTLEIFRFIHPPR